MVEEPSKAVESGKANEGMKVIAVESYEVGSDKVVESLYGVAA